MATKPKVRVREVWHGGSQTGPLYGFGDGGGEAHKLRSAMINLGWDLADERDLEVLRSYGVEVEKAE